MDGFGTPEGSLRRKQQIKIANSKTIKKTRPAILPLKENETKSVISYIPFLRGSPEEGMISKWEDARPSPQPPNYQPTHGQCSMKAESYSHEKKNKKTKKTFKFI